MFGPNGGVLANGVPKATLARLPAPTIDMVKPRSKAVFDVDDTDAAASETQMGLYDNLEDMSSGARAMMDASEPDNYVGGDSRRFYIRVVDAAAKGRKFLEADVEWWTSFANNDRRDRGAHEVEDDPPSKLSMFEVAAKPGVFVSRGLMIVDDNEDRGLPTNSGVPAGHPLSASHGGLRTDQQSNFRLRRGGMHSFVVASYTRKGSSTAIKSKPVPVFAPTSQKLMPLQVYVVRTSAGGTPAIDPDLVFKTDLLETLEVYARIGVWCWTFVSASDMAKPGVTVVKASSGIPFSLAVVDPPAGISITSADTKEFFALDKAFPGEPNTLRQFFVTSLAGGFQGISFPQSGSTPSGPTGTSFVNASHTPYTSAHELGHVLTDKAPNKGHYEEDLATSPRAPAALNLMAGFGGKAARSVTQSKRIWELDPGFHGPGGVPMLQLAKILGSPFLR